MKKNLPIMRSISRFCRVRRGMVLILLFSGILGLVLSLFVINITIAGTGLTQRGEYCALSVFCAPGLTCGENSRCNDSTARAAYQTCYCNAECQSGNCSFGAGSGTCQVCPKGQEKPHNECIETTCQSIIDSCGVNTCKTNDDCGAAPAGGEAGSETGGETGGETGEGTVDEEAGGETTTPAISVALTNPLGVNSFEDLIGKIIDFLVKIGIFIAPIFFIFAGFLFLTAGGDPNKISTAKNLILWTLVGLAILLVGKGLISILEQILEVKETTFLLPLSV